MKAICTYVIGVTLFTLCWDTVFGVRSPREKPNIVLFLADDLGYGDFSSYGHPTQEVGAVDRLALEGIRFTQYYSPSSLCSPSRASLLTGLSPVRVGVYGSGGEEVFVPDDVDGLPRHLTTIAEALKEFGYVSGIVGKWHLGINKFSRNDNYHHPMHHGFDYVGTFLPFTNSWFCDDTKTHFNNPIRRFCFLYYNTTMIQQPFHLHNLSSALVQDAKAFIYDNADRPFFLYYPLVHMHTALHRNPKFVNTSRRGPYGDDMNEMQWSVEEIVKTLEEEGLEENTLVIFLSDNGPHLDICLEGGSPGTLKGGKYTTWEGGVRIPAIMRWPGTIAPHQVSHSVLSTLDILPTLVDLVGGGESYGQDNIESLLLGKNQTGNDDAGQGSDTAAIDGISFKSLLLGENQVEHEVLHFYSDRYLTAIRLLAYKVHYYTKEWIPQESLAQQFCAAGGAPRVSNFACNGRTLPCLVPHDPPLLFNLETDPEERYPLDPGQYGWLIERIAELVKEHEAHLVVAPSLLAHKSFLVQPCCNPPYCLCNFNRLLN